MCRKCLKMLTELPLEQIAQYENLEGRDLNPVKELLAFELTKLVHGEEEAQKAQNASKALFGAGPDSENVPTTQLTEGDLTEGSIGLLDLMVKCGLAPSKGEARRLVQQGGVLVNNEKVTDATVRYTAQQLSEELMIKKGKKTFHRVTLNG